MTGAPVCATRGGEGMLVSDPEMTLVPGVRVEGPTDPTGAGDSATAGAVLALAAGAELARGRAGGQPGGVDHRPAACHDRHRPARGTAAAAGPLGGSSRDEDLRLIESRMDCGTWEKPRDCSPGGVRLNCFLIETGLHRTWDLGFGILFASPL